MKPSRIACSPGGGDPGTGWALDTPGGSPRAAPLAGTRRAAINVQGATGGTMQRCRGSAGMLAALARDASARGVLAMQKRAPAFKTFLGQCPVSSAPSLLRSRHDFLTQRFKAGCGLRRLATAATGRLSACPHPTATTRRATPMADLLVWRDGRRQTLYRRSDTPPRRGFDACLALDYQRQRIREPEGLRCMSWTGPTGTSAAAPKSDCSDREAVLPLDRPPSDWP